MDNQEIAFRINVVLACAAGCVTGGLAALLALIKTDSEVLAIATSVLMPSCFCNAAGIRNRQYLIPILVYTAIGWLLAMLMMPTVSMGPTAILNNIIHSPLAGHDKIVLPLVLSSILAVTRASFVSRFQAQPTPPN